MHLCSLLKQQHQQRLAADRFPILSRPAAGIRGRTLIINLPGSKKASEENILAVIDPVEHGLEMLLGEGSADCAAPVK